MRYLLDTHTLYWWLYFPELLPRKVLLTLSDPAVNGLVSAVSAYEMAYKYRLGKWPEVAALASTFDEIVTAENFELLPISAKHAARAGLYAIAHRDPFDRLLAAQAELDDLILVTNDRRLADFGTRTIW